MKRAYYIFSIEKKLEKCFFCPMLDESWFGSRCKLLQIKVDPACISKNCPLVYVEGKVEQN